MHTKLPQIETGSAASIGERLPLPLLFSLPMWILLESRFNW